MNIQLSRWKVQELSLKLKKSPSESKPKKQSFTLSLGNSFSESSKKEFSIAFQIVIDDIDFDLSLEMVFFFKLDSDVTEEFKTSKFISINAPAIAFPFVRSYISNLTLQSGLSTIILPSVNFVEFSKLKKHQE